MTPEIIAGVFPFPTLTGLCWRRGAEAVDNPNFKSAVFERKDQSNKSGRYSQIGSIMRGVQVAEGQDPSTRLDQKRDALVYHSNLENIAVLLRQASVSPEIIRGHMSQGDVRTAHNEAVSFQKTVTGLLERLQELKSTTGRWSGKKKVPPESYRFPFSEIFSFTLEKELPFGIVRAIQPSLERITHEIGKIQSMLKKKETPRPQPVSGETPAKHKAGGSKGP
jgi:hypothetical protein